jgi:N-acetylmuramoyl-L-alanine amidase
MGRDEWEMARQDANVLYVKLVKAGFVDSHVIVVDRNDPRWKAVGALASFAGAGGLKSQNIDIRAKWAKAVGCEVVLELHYNADAGHAGRGYEVLTYEDPQMGVVESTESRRLGTSLLDAFAAAWPDRVNRGVKAGNWRVLGMLRDKIPASVIVEPAFIHEACLIDMHKWRAAYMDALVAGVKAYAGA